MTTTRKRPRSIPRPLREETISVRFTAAEVEKLHQNATQFGISVSALIRHKLGFTL